MTKGSPVGWLHVLIDVAPEVAASSAAFWSDALGWPAGEPEAEHPEFRSFVPPDGVAYVHQQVGDHGPRIHLDAEVDDVAAETERLIGLGAAAGAHEADWQALRSPGGLPFCLVTTQSTGRPGPQRWSGGHRTRAVQVCIDAPPRHVETEVAFWRQVTGWRWVPGDSPEFVGKLYGDPADPVHLLLQRLESDEPSTRAHLDLGSDDIEAEVRRLCRLGAARRGTGDGFVVMTDPVGLEFCVTGNAPD
jgi:Glyoxalase-like domain